jgi:putative molybdopterin biosynthesis protein
MPIFLKDIPLDQAVLRFRQALESHDLTGPLPAEEILLDERACGRVLADGIWAKICSPHYHASAMDGFAVRAADTAPAMASRPVSLRLGEQAFYVDTGDPLPDGTNAVIPIEQVEPLGGDDPRHPFEILVRAAVSPWSHIRLLGEDIVTSQLIAARGQQLRPSDLGAIAASGNTTLRVIRQPVVAILPTGDELVPIGTQPQQGDILEYNSLVMAAQVNSWGGKAVRYPITPDDKLAIQAQVEQAAESADLILLNAGSSAGSEDFSAEVISTLGTLLVHGVAVRPGHPVIIGILPPTTTRPRAVPIFGVPGYPVSAALTCELFVRPLLEEWSGLKNTNTEVVEATLARKVNSPAGDDDVIRVSIGDVRGRLLAAPLPRGAGVITSLTRADGITVIPRGIQGLEAGERVRVELYRPAREVRKTVLISGSHDLSLDVLAEYLSARGARLAASNVGSLGGLNALARGEAHASGCHLLDVETGTYNDLFIRQYLPGIPVLALGWAERVQGLIVPRGNPLNITSLADLTRPEVTFSNRQRGAGTRVLLDYQLKRAEIQAKDIQGYADEEYTHLGVAAAVFSHRADCGLGIQAAADALGLDFIPLFNETYEIIIPLDLQDHPGVQLILAATQDPVFKQNLKAFSGYGWDSLGQIRYPH